MKKQTKTACVILAFAAILGGCKKSDALKSDSEVLSKAYGKLSAGDNEYDLLGYGYDLTQEYAHYESGRFKVIDIEKLKRNQPDRVEKSIGVYQYSTVEAGANSYDYSLSLSSKFSATAGFALFKGTINGSFKDSTKISNKYSFAHISQIIKQKNIKFNATNEQIMSDYLSETFKSDLNTLTPGALVSKYGTHVLSNIILGAKLEIYYRTITNSSDKKRAATAGATVNGLESLFSSNVDYTFDESLAKTNTSQTLSYRTVGGDGSKGLMGEVDLDKPITKVNIGDWQSTCTIANATIIDIAPDGIIPLYDLIADPVKKEVIKLYINQYLIDRGVRSLGDVPIYVYNSQKWKDHYFTPDNKQTIGNGDYVNEGIAFYAFSRPAEGTVPVYVYNNQQAGDHYFSTDNFPSIGGGSYKNEGIAFHAYRSSGNGRVPVYVYNFSGASDHYFSTEDAASIGGGYYKKEGVAFYVPN